jgi:anti-sigma B factor antagonist
MADEFRIERSREGRAVVVAPEGDVDLRTAPALREALQAALSEASCLVLDLRSVTFMDSSGIRLVVEAQQSTAADGIALAVVPGPEHVQRVFDLSGLTDRLTLVDDPSQAAERGVGADG